MSVYDVKPSGCSKVGAYIFGLFLLISLIASMFAFRYSRQVVTTATQPPPPVPTLSHNEIRGRAIAIAYDDLARDTERYIGRNVVVYGRVTQVVEGSGGNAMTLLVMVDDGDLVLIHHEGRRVLRNDGVAVYAIVKGRATYTTVLGARVTVPELTATLIDINK